ncbi:MAG: EcsC family protein [Okeania sp. SIO2F4]|uniref:EcsC family protein n=1 Tax=Okeania sp. SIO2F4 TaxID=2607790 RepID=UPI00142C294F|nr:EcsC family protein [Okeania sp. SIO2F4]NES08102.1 EcsC family protein [Okeania sp. SIO2F4]
MTTTSADLSKTPNQNSSFFGSLFGSVRGAAQVVGNATVQAACGAGEAIGSVAVNTTHGLGYVTEMVNNSRLLSPLTKALKIELLEIVDQIDIVKAETEIQRLQQKYPNESPSEISHRVILEKAIYVGGTGVATSIVPGIGLGLIAVDLTVTTAIQAEMVYQIAYAYGFDLQEPARKGEVLGIFGLAVGGGQALKAGLGFMRNVPLAGAVIGGSTNAVMLYSLGYAACRFYEAKLAPETMEAALETAQVDTQKYLKAAIAQQAIMDQILVHVILAGNPGKTWEQILPELEGANLSPGSLEIIQKNIKSPPSLEKLLAQVNDEFAISVVAQSQKIAELDEVITPQEKKVLELISKKLKVDLAAVEMQVLQNELDALSDILLE